MNNQQNLEPAKAFDLARQVARQCLRDGLTGNPSDYELGALRSCYKQLWREHQRLRRLAGRHRELASSSGE